MVVEGIKESRPVTDRRKDFLEAAKTVIDNLHKFWPLSIRQIHYNLLPIAPQKNTTKNATKKQREKNKYKNDQSSYKALSRLLNDARYEGLIPFRCIADATRPTNTYGGWSNASDFIRNETEYFMCGFRMNMQLNQPDHIEVLAEKKTIGRIIEPVCDKFQVAYTLGAGYGNPSVWSKMANRYQQSGKDRMILVIVSDYDPEGFDLANDAVKALRTHFGVNVQYKRAAVNRSQIDELKLAEDFNPAKPDSTRLKKFIELTGGTDTWECEALPPEYLQVRLDDAVRSVLDIDIWNETIKQEERYKREISTARHDLIEILGI